VAINPVGPDNNGLRAAVAGMQVVPGFTRISDSFGPREAHPVTGLAAMHNGIDFAAPMRTPVYAADNGVVGFSGQATGYGLVIYLNHTIP